MGEDYKNAAEIVYYTLASVLTIMQIQEIIQRQKKKPSIKRKGQRKRQKRK